MKRFFWKKFFLVFLAITVILATFDETSVSAVADNTQEPVLSTNKLDYFPTETVIVSGANFISNREYTLNISSTDPPPVNFETHVTTNSVGSFVYAYQLDGNYRPNYKVEIKNLDGVVVATTTFTDTAGTETLTAATGGGAIGSATNTTDGVATWTTLTGPTLIEGTEGDIGIGTIVLDAPNGFVFDTGGVAPSVLLAGDATASKNINNAVGGSTIALTSITSTALTLTITSKSSGVVNSLTWQNIRVRPTVASPLVSGNITKSGTSTYSVAGGATNYGTLTETDTTSPTGSISINSNDTYTNSQSVVLNFSGVSSDVTQIKLRNGTVGSFQTVIAYENPHTYALPSNGDGTYTVSVRFIDSSGNQSAGVISDTLILDSTVPTDPTNVSSTSHGVSFPSTDKTIDMTWALAGNTFGATDVSSGVDGYSYSFTTGATDVPDTVKDAEETATGVTSSSLSDGSWYFHLRTRDNAGNWTSTVHKGPYVVDTTAPTSPGTPTVMTPGEKNKPTWSWTAASDVGGLDLYIFFWDTAAGGQVNNSGNLTSSTLSYTNSLPLIDGMWYGKVKAFDIAGNFSVSGNASYLVDTTGPTTPAPSPIAGDYTNDQLVTLSSSDTLGSVAGIYYSLDGSIPSSTSGTLYSGAISVNKDLTLKAIAYDNLGNSSGILTAIYGVAPVISAEASSSVSSDSVTISWTTDDPATSRVVYDTVSHLVLGSSSNYGYANSTVEADLSPKVVSHSVLVGSLTAGMTYYYRVISHGSPESVSDEKSFTTSTAAVSSTSGGLSSSSGGGGEAVVCNDSKPGSAPVLLSAVAGFNNVTLFWTKAQDPVTYYLVTYGLATGSQTFGNPNVGGKEVESYVVSNLSGGVTYYFRVRAGNGCKPGDYSNELAATALGSTVVGLAGGFTPGVLGTTENLGNGLATDSGVLGTGSAEVREIPFNSSRSGFNWWLIVLIFSFGTIFILIWRRRRL